MKTNAIHRFSLLLLGLVSLTAWTQQSVPSPAADDSSRVIANQDTSAAQLETTDGVAGCPADFKFRSVPDGVYRVGGDVLPPIPMEAPKATFPDEARKYAREFMKKQHIKRFEAKSVVGLTVNTNGIPQDICVLNEAGHGFDRKAVKTVAEYRFKPATLDGKPVPVRLAIDVTFALW